MKTLLIGLLIGMAALSARASFDPHAELQKLQLSGAETAMGNSTDTGVWLLAVGVADVNGRSEKEAMAMAAVEAKKQLAGFFETQLAASTATSYEESDAGVKETFAQWSRSDINTVLKGVRIISNTVSGGKAKAAALLTSKAIDFSKQLQQAMQTTPPGTVEAVGDGVSLEAAIQAASRSALEQVCGVSVLASDQVLNGAIRSQSYSDVQGMVSNYRIIEQAQTATGYHVRILAAIDKDELQESYGAQMKSIGDPLFYLVSTNDDALRQLSDWLMGKGLKTTTHQGTSDYKVEILTKFIKVKHPATGKKGTQLQLTAVCYDKAGVQLFSLQNDPRKAATFVGDDERQSQIAVEKAVNQISKPLHERLQRAIADLTNNGRTVRFVFRNVRTQEQVAAIESLTDLINQTPGATAASFSRNDAVAVVTLRFTLKGNTQTFLSLLREQSSALPAALTVSANKVVFEL